MNKSCEEISRELEAVQTEMEQLKAAASRQNETLRLLERALLATNVSMTIMDARQPGAPLVYANPGFERMSGYSADELIGRNPRFLRREEQDQTAGDDLDRAIKAGQEHTAVLRNYRKDGSLFWNELHLSPMRDENDVITHYVGIQHDVTERKQQETTHLQNDQYRRVVEDQTELICRYTPDFVLRFVNDAYLIHFGKDSTQLVGQNILTLIAPEDVEQAKSHVQGLTRENPVSTSEHRSIMLDGSYRWFQWKDRAIFNDKGEITEYQGVGRDVTEQKQIEESLRQRDEQWKAIFNIAPVGMAMTNMSDYYVQVNPAFCNLVGYTADELMGMTFRQLTHPDDLGTNLKLGKKLTEGEMDNVLWEKRFLRKDGRVIHTRVHGAITHDAEGKPLHFLSQIVDITEDKRAEDALKAKHSLMRTLIDNIPDYIFAKDLEGRFLISNQAHAAAGGVLNPDDLVGKRAEDVFPSTLASQFSDDDLEVIRTGQPLLNVERTTVNRVGESRKVLTTKVPLVGPDQKTIGVVGVSRDITYRKNAENALRWSEARNRAFLNAIPDSIFRMNQQGVFLDYRAAPEGLYVSPDRIIGGKVDDLLPKDLVKLTHDNIEAALKTGQMQVYEYQLETQQQGLLDFEARMVASETDEVLVIVRDVTDRKRTELELERSAKRLGTYHTIDQAILAAQSLEDIAEAALSYIRDLIPCDRASVATFDYEKLLVRMLMVSTSLETEANTGFTTPLPSSSAAVLEQDNVLYIRDLSALSLRVNTQDILYKEGLHSQLSVPLKSNNTLIGSLNLSSTEPNFFTDEHIEIVKEIAQQIAIALWQGQLRAQVQQHTEELEQRVAQRTLEVTQAKERVEAILNGTAEGIILVHPTFGIEQVNLAFNKLFASQSADYVHTPLAQLAAPENRPALEEAIHSALAGQTISDLEFRAVRKDGTFFDAQIGIAPASESSEQGHSLVCNLADITERKAFEQQNRYHASLLETLSDAVISTDFKFNIRSWNHAAEQIYGWSREEAIQRSVNDTLKTDYTGLGQPELLVKQLMEKGQWGGEVVQTKKDGELVHILSSVTVLKDERGNPTGTVAVNRDITERKRAENALQESEERFRLLMEAAPQSIVLSDSTGKIVLVNLETEMSFGYSRDELLGKNVEILVPLRYRQDMAASSQYPYTRPMAHSEEAYGMRKDGSEFPIAIDTRAIEMHPDMLMMAFITDITERKQAEDSVSTYARQVHDLYNNAPCGYHSVDSSGLVVQMNSTELSWLGYDAYEVIGKMKFTDLIVPQQSGLFYDGLSLTRERGGIKDVEYTMLRKDGTSFPVLLNASAVLDDNGRFLMNRATVFDITERKQQEESIHRNQIFLDSVIENIPAMIFVKDARDLRFVRLNKAGEQLLQINRDHYLHKNDYDIFPEEQARFFVAKDRQVLESGVLLDLPEEEIRSQDGEIHYLHTRKIPMLGSNGQPEYLLGISEDITERKRAEEALLKTSGQLQAILDNSSSAIYVMDTQDRYTLVNKRFCEMTGFTQEGIVGKSVNEVYDPEVSKIFLATDHQVMQENRFVETEETFRTHDQRLVTHFTVKFPLRDASGQPYAVCGISADITERKRAEESFRKTSELLQAILDTSSAVIYLMDGDNNLLLANRRYAEIFNINLADSIGKPMSIRFPEELATQFQKNDDLVKTQKRTIEIEERVPHHDGKVHTYISVKSPLLDRDGKVYAICGISTDISSRKQAEEALRESEQRFRSYFELPLIGVAITSPDKKWLDVNDRMCDLLGYKQDELANLTWEQLTHPDDVNADTTQFNHLFAGEIEGYNLDKRYIRKDGQVIFTNITVRCVRRMDGSINYFVALVQDITARKQAEDELRESEERFKIIFEHSPDIIMLSDLHGTLLDVNTTFEDLTGYHRYQVRGKDYLSLGLFPDTQRPVALDALSELGRGEAVPPIDFTLMCLDSSHIEIEARFFSVALYGQKLVLMTGRDITRRKEVEHELREALAQQQELNELKTRFVSMASHEFRTPLATIMATTDSLGAYRKKMEDAVIDKRLDKIREQIHHLKHIIEDVTQYSKLQSRETELQMNMHAVDLEQFCRDIVDEFQKQLPPTNQLIFTCAEKPPLTVVDPKLMHQSVTNLIQNALKYSPEGKSVYLDLAYTADEIRLSVKDEGIGIPEADRKHLFEAFHRAANVGTISGTGMGLAITKQSVELQGGKIGFETTEGSGTRFVITLPIKAKNKVTYGKNTGY